VLNSKLYKPDINSICQVWKYPSSIKKCADMGYRTILSAGYYLDMVNNNFENSPITPAYTFVDIWKNMYSLDPYDQFPNDTSSSTLSKVVGVEAAMWTENVSDETLISTVYPRLSAIAERGWSSRTLTLDNTNIKDRLVNNRCYIQLKRGYKNIPPVAPTFCVYQYDRTSASPTATVSPYPYITVGVLSGIVALLFILLIATAIGACCLCKKYKQLKKSYQHDITFSEDKLSAYYSLREKGGQ